MPPVSRCGYSWQAQALSCKLGEYAIWRLWREAEFRLGADSGIRLIHDLILAPAFVPPDNLKDEAGRWMAEQVAGIAASAAP